MRDPKGVSENMMRWMTTGMAPGRAEKQLAGDDLKNKAREELLVRACEQDHRKPLAIRSGSTNAAAAFLQPYTSVPEKVADEHFAVAVRRRLGWRVLPANALRGTHCLHRAGKRRSLWF